MAHVSHPVSLLSKLYSESKFSDITFKVENEVFNVHKSLLSASCPYFEVMLYGNTYEASQKVINLNETSAAAFKCVLDFIYTGNIDTNAFDKDTHCLEVVALSHEYQFDGLLAKIIEVIPWHEKHCLFLFTVLKMALMYEYNALKEKCMEFIDEKGDEIMSAMNEFACLPFSAVSELIRRDTFNVNELDLFRCLMYWKECHIDADISDFLRNIRLGLVTHEDFTQFIEPYKVYDFESYLSAMQGKRLRSNVNCEMENKISTSFATEIRNGKSKSLNVWKEYILDVGCVLYFRLPEEIHNAQEICFTLDEFVSTRYLTLQVKSEQDLEYTVVSDLTGEYRFGAQCLHIKPQKVKYILVECNAPVKFPNLAFKCRAKCTVSFDENDRNLIGKLATAKISKTEIGHPLPHKRFQEIYKFFVFPQPCYYKCIMFKSKSVMKIPSDIYVKGKLDDEWSKLDFARTGIKKISFKMCLISLILLVGTDLHLVKFRAM